MKNKVWMVTGASQGLGLVVTEKLLENGHQVIATSRNKEKLEAKFSGHPNLLAVNVDITNESSIKKAVEEGVAKFGSIDILLNNAGYGQMWTFEETSSQEAQKYINDNLLGTLNVIRAVLPTMRSQKSGHIYVTSSGWGYATVPYNSLYAACKFALDGFAESISNELRPLGITISSIKPGGFRTNFLTNDSLVTGNSIIEDYTAGRDEWVNTVKSWNGYQDGNPEKYAQLLVDLSNRDEIPMHIFTGRDSYEMARNKIKSVEKDLNDLESLATNLHFE
ncbi:SDR family oxidoreductase [Spiroplasma monobiae]|uniref:Dehydrogenase n=1 Tax=Spiroplasma monobiae MQ-1 TaxID=1336748 RepID=A0A2K9LUG4_SPISQ|nr:SDR family oxidoreductase [Spiroplasma monobiae]AUM62687.1 dehydrogenase [Spiroplasma monobiae MQ-1]